MELTWKKHAFFFFFCGSVSGGNVNFWISWLSNCILFIIINTLTGNFWIICNNCTRNISNYFFSYNNICNCFTDLLCTFNLIESLTLSVPNDPHYTVDVGDCCISIPFCSVISYCVVGSKLYPFSVASITWFNTFNTFIPQCMSIYFTRQLHIGQTFFYYYVNIWLIVRYIYTGYHSRWSRARVDYAV